MSKNKNRRRETILPAAIVVDKIPLVSVIIPMYNAARFIRRTMESLLYQTMRDFEVVVVDDCSTDNSVEIVESFAERFDGRLHLVKLPKNNGMPCLPRNVGIQFARGKYITFMDNDDFYAKTALEELTTLAEKYQAEVVHTDTFFLLEGENINICKRQRLPVVSNPVFETRDFAQRIRQWINRGYNWEPYTMFCRRDFIVSKQINFPKLKAYEDMIFSFAILCFAEKFLRVPNLTYIYQKRSDSLSCEDFTETSERFCKYIKVLNDGFNFLAKIMASIPFFEKNPEYRYAVLNFYFNDVLESIRPLYLKNNPFMFVDLMKRELQSYNEDFVAHLFNAFNIQRLQIMRLQQELAKFHQK